MDPHLLLYGTQRDSRQYADLTQQTLIQQNAPRKEYALSVALFVIDTFHQEVSVVYHSPVEQDN